MASFTFFSSKWMDGLTDVMGAKKSLRKVSLDVEMWWIFLFVSLRLRRLPERTRDLGVLFLSFQIKFFEWFLSFFIPRRV